MFACGISVEQADINMQVCFNISLEDAHAHVRVHTQRHTHPQYLELLSAVRIINITILNFMWKRFSEVSGTNVRHVKVSLFNSNQSLDEVAVHYKLT